MRQPGMGIDVGPGETTAQLLDQLNKVPQRTQLLLRLPRDAKALRELDDFNKLRQVAANRELQLVISSPEKTIVGLARLLGFEVDGKPAGVGTAAPDPVVAAAPTARPAPPAAGGSPTVSVAVPAMPPQPPAPAFSPAPATPLSENDWLFGGDQAAVPDDHVEAVGGMPPRQATPPPDVHIVGGPGVTPAPRPPAGDEFDDIDAMNFDDAELERDSAQYRQQIATNTAERTGERASEAEIAALEASLAASAAPPKASRAPNGNGGMLGGLLGGSRKPARVVPRDTAPRPRAAAPARPAAAASLSAPPVALPHSLLDDEPHQPQADSAAAIAMPMPIPVPAPRPAVVPRVERPGPVVRTRPTTARRGAGLWVAVALIALLGIMLAAAWGVLTFLPQATVSVIPATQVVLHPVEVLVSTTGGGLSAGGGTAAPALSASAQMTDTATLQVDPLSAPPLQAAAVAAKTFTDHLSAEASVPTSGSRDQAAGKDKISLALVNPTGGRVVLSAGTEVSSGGGVTFRLTQDVAVNGATDTGTSLVYGQGTAEAEAAEVGPHTVGAGAVAGTFANGVRYRSTAAAEGGYIEKIATVAQVDVERLHNELQAKLQGAINGAIIARVPKDMTAILPTLSVPDSAWKEELDHAVGDDATDLHMKMSVTGSIAAYNPQDVEQAIKQVVASQGVPNDPLSDPQMDPASIQQGPLEMVGSPAGDQVTYRTVTTATVQYNLTPDMQAQIKDLVRGKPVADAKAAVLTDPYLGKYLSDITITSGLSGLLNLTQDRVPDDPARIKVQSPEASQP